MCFIPLSYKLLSTSALLCNPLLVGIKVKSEDQTGNVKLNVSGNFYSAS